MDTATFLQTHCIFSLDKAVRALDPAGGRKGTLERLKYAASRGKVKKLARGVYASIPPGVDPKKSQLSLNFRRRDDRSVQAAQGRLSRPV